MRIDNITASDEFKELFCTFNNLVEERVKLHPELPNSNKSVTTMGPVGGILDNSHSNYVSFVLSLCRAYLNGNIHWQ